MGESKKPTTTMAPSREVRLEQIKGSGALARRHFKRPREANPWAVHSVEWTAWDVGWFEAIPKEEKLC